MVETGSTLTLDEVLKEFEEAEAAFGSNFNGFTGDTFSTAFKETLQDPTVLEGLTEEQKVYVLRWLADSAAEHTVEDLNIEVILRRAVLETLQSQFDQLGDEDLFDGALYDLSNVFFDSKVWHLDPNGDEYVKDILPFNDDQQDLRSIALAVIDAIEPLVRQELEKRVTSGLDTHTAQNRLGQILAGIFNSSEY